MNSPLCPLAPMPLPPPETKLLLLQRLLLPRRELPVLLGPPQDPGGT